jgi:DNA-binding Xre family transcriptional regulator
MEKLNRIKELCESQGLTGYEFWKKTGMPQSTAYRLWGDAAAYPSKDHLVKICKALNVQPGDVFVSNGKVKISA